MSRFTNLRNRIHNHTFLFMNLSHNKCPIYILRIKYLHPSHSSTSRYHYSFYFLCFLHVRYHHTLITRSMHPHTLPHRHLPNLPPLSSTDPHSISLHGLHSRSFSYLHWLMFKFEGFSYILRRSSLHPPHFLLISSFFRNTFASFPFHILELSFSVYLLSFAHPSPFLKSFPFLFKTSFLLTTSAFPVSSSIPSYILSFFLYPLPFLPTSFFPSRILILSF